MVQLEFPGLAELLVDEREGIFHHPQLGGGKWWALVAENKIVAYQRIVPLPLGQSPLLVVIDRFGDHPRVLRRVDEVSARVVHMTEDVLRESIWDMLRWGEKGGRVEWLS